MIKSKKIKNLFAKVICVFFIYGVAALYAMTDIASLIVEVSDSAGSPVKGAVVEIAGTKFKSGTDDNGKVVFSEVSPGKYELKINAIGYKAKAENIEIPINGEKRVLVQLEIALTITKKGIVITKEKNDFVKKDEISMQSIKSEDLKKSAGALEDAFKVIHTLPGVVKQTDFDASMYVRGGEREQNLVLVDRLYLGNPYHMGGFTSLINPDVIEKVDFYAGGMLAEGGQSLSSVIDITTQEGNSEKTRGMIDVSLLTFKMKLDGPIIKNIGKSKTEKFFFIY